MRALALLPIAAVAIALVVSGCNQSSTKAPAKTISTAQVEYALESQHLPVITGHGAWQNNVSGFRGVVSVSGHTPLSPYPVEVEVYDTTQQAEEAAQAILDQLSATPEDPNARQIYVEAKGNLVVTFDAGGPPPTARGRHFIAVTTKALAGLSDSAPSLQLVSGLGHLYPSN